MANTLTTPKAHYLAWTQKYLLTGAESLARLVTRPPAAEDAEAAFATAFELKREKYENPFRQAAAIIEADDIYDGVRRSLWIGVNTTDAMRLLAKSRVGKLRKDACDIL